jgi:hypothetical protein
MRRCALFYVMGFLVGCASEPNYPLRSHIIEPIDSVGLPGAAGLAPSTALAAWNAASSRLAEDIPRAVKRLNWGLLEIALPDAAGPGGPPIRASALLPDNRVATIHGWRLSESRVVVGVLVGRFGDARIEQEFLQMIADVLAGPPAPKRGGTFALPADWPSAK